MRKRDCAILFAITAYLIWPLFRMEYMANWGSIESTFISDARYLNENWPNPTWQPNWYLGGRWDYIYPPALRYATAAIARYGGVSTARAYHLYIATMYCIGIVGVYLFVATAMRSRRWAWIAALAAGSLSPVFLFLAHIRADNVLVRYMPMRLGVLVRYGEGPHMSAFALIPLALAAAWTGLRDGSRRWLGVSALLSALVVSNNFYGATALAMLFPCVVWAIYVSTRDRAVWPRAIAIAALAYGLTAVWLVPSYLRVTMENMKLVSQPGNAWSAGLALAVIAALAAGTWRYTRDAWLIFTVCAFSLVSLNVLGHYYFGFRVTGEPERLTPEFDLVWILASITLMRWMWPRGMLYKLAVVAVLFWSITVCKGWLRRSHQFLEADEDPKARIEYQLTNWLSDHVPGQRIFASGSMRFWFNAWRTLSQTGGGSEQGCQNMTSVYAYFGVTSNVPVEDTVLWMQASGTGVLPVHDQRSREYYHDIENPERFRGKLKVLHDTGEGDVIYEIPRRFPDLARVVRADAVRAIDVIHGNLDKLRAYVDAVERGPDRRAEMRHAAPEVIRVKASLEPGDAVLVQETYDPNWRATSNGKPVAVTKDPANFMLLDAGAGAHDIELRFHTPLENQAGRVVTIGSILVLIWMIAARRP